MNRFPHFLASLVLCLGSITSQATDKPNIMLIMCDDLGWGDVGFNGNKVIRTPHLDAMAKAGIKFNRFYAAAPVCSPTRGSCITGRHPYRYGIPFANSGHMKPEELTLAELLKKKGYTTGHFGKWHLGTLTKTLKDANRGGPRGTKHFSPPQMNGFDVCFSTESKVPTWDPLFRPKGNNSRKWWDSVSDDGEAVPYGTAYWNERGESVTENTRGANSRVIMDRAIPFVRSATKRNQPFFCIVWFHTPHLPVVAGPRYAAMYAAHPKYAQHYYGCITAMDEQVGRLRAELRALGVADDTLLFFCSDNGPEGQAGKAPGSAGHLSGRKRSLLEGGIRVPGIVEWPGRVQAGRSTNIPCVTSDYLPTVIDLVGAKPVIDRPIDGISLVPLLDDNLAKRGQSIGFESKGQLAWMGDRYKLYRKSNAADFKLFDLVADPSEKTDLAKQKPNLAKRLAMELAAWRTSCRTSAAGEDY
ncbi:MAG: sulfatase-like hydrolase/transferase [Verrucomicrobiota bacterium]|nr:sulfatase-like hydrolase/transferase [Verrucomicrobiota bacterium]